MNRESREYNWLLIWILIADIVVFSVIAIMIADGLARMLAS